MSAKKLERSLSARSYSNPRRSQYGSGTKDRAGTKFERFFSARLFFPGDSFPDTISEPGITTDRENVFQEQAANNIHHYLSATNNIFIGEIRLDVPPTPPPPPPPPPPLPPQFRSVQLSENTNVSVTMPTLLSSIQQVGAEPNTNLTKYVPLYQAALAGNWDKAKNFIHSHPEALTARITKGRETALHIAAGAKQTKFVAELVKLMDTKDLALKNKSKKTALCFAAASGITEIAKMMVKKNNNLQAVTALHTAALLGYREMVTFLYKVTDGKDLKKKDYIRLIFASINSEMYDVALDILLPRPELAIEEDSNGETALHVLARKPSAFSGRSQQGIWQRSICSWIQMLTPDAYQSHKNSPALRLLRCFWEQFLLLDDPCKRDLLRSLSKPLFVAAEFGNFEFIAELIRSYPDLIWNVDEEYQSIFHIAVMHRQEKIFKLIYGMGAYKDLITYYKDTNNNNILHLAGELAPSDRLKIVSGAALQMQRELLWFKEVEKNVQPLFREMRNKDGLTPRMLFTEEHKQLVKEGEKWMKGTASSCMLVATLITTVMFAAIFTVPGGNSNEGTPIFLKAKSFITFAISDASALFSSVTSILMFLSILTSRYAEKDFLNSLPNRLIIGLTTLFFSIASMLIAFGATFFVLLGNQLAWIAIPVALTTAIPVTLFAFLQFPLLADMMHSTYGPGIFARKHKDMLF